MKTIRHLTGGVSLALAFGAEAQSNGAGAKSQKVTAPAAAAATPNTEDVIRKPDKDQGKLNIKHGPIANLGTRA